MKKIAKYLTKYVVSLHVQISDDDSRDNKDSDTLIDNEIYDGIYEISIDTDIRNRSWAEWSSSHPSTRDWLISEAEQNYKTGEDKVYSLFVKRTDKKPLTISEFQELNEKLQVGHYPKNFQVRHP